MGVVQEFEARVDTVGATRSYVRDLLLHDGCSDEVIDAAVQCTSELATNALLHGDGRIAVEVDLADVVRVIVHDRGRRLPVAPHPDVDVDADRGRGLLLVSVFADAWGFVAADEGKAVWFEIDLRKRAAAGAVDERQRRRSDQSV
jgi:anti-sigma regulatory factor (Ser/Thr protein kinase)